MRPRPSVYRSRVWAGLCPACCKPHATGRQHCDACLQRHQSWSAAAKLRSRRESRILRAETFAEHRARTKAKRHVKRYADVLARCQPPRCAEVIPAEAYRAYDALVDGVLARAGFKPEPLSPGEARKLANETRREGPLAEVFGPFLPHVHGNKLPSKA